MRYWVNFNGVIESWLVLVDSKLKLLLQKVINRGHLTSTVFPEKDSTRQTWETAALNEVCQLKVCFQQPLQVEFYSSFREGSNNHTVLMWVNLLFWFGTKCLSYSGSYSLHLSASHFLALQNGLCSIHISYLYYMHSLAQRDERHGNLSQENHLCSNKENTLSFRAQVDCHSGRQVVHNIFIEYVRSGQAIWGCQYCHSCYTSLHYVLTAQHSQHHRPC